MIRWLIGCSFAILACAGLIGCGGQTPAAGEAASGGGKVLSIVCTTGQVGDLVTNLGGEHVKVTTLMGPGVDPHLYRGTLADTQALERADLVFYNGLHLEGRLAESLEHLAERKPVYAVSEEILKSSPELLRQPQEFEGNYDPHIWFDASLWKRCADAAAKRLIEIDPSHADDYRANAAKYCEELDKLHSWCKEQVALIPRDSAVMVTAHDAFGYFGRAYGIEVHGLQGISTADEADLATVNQLVDLLCQRKVKAVFIESSVPPKTIQSLIEGCAARGHTVTQGGELFSDALGAAGTPEGTYTGMVRHNVNTIVGALK
jgi:manganese/zinc/iron transport system substrate-binding protein